MRRRKFIKDSWKWTGLLFVPRLLRAQNVFPPAFWAPPAAAGSSSTLLNGLKVYYALSDLTDATGGGLTLTNTNTVTFIGGKVGNCAHFVSASSQVLSRADNAAFQMGTGDFSFACWVKSTTSSTLYICVYGNTDAAAGYGMEWISTGIRVKISDGTHVIVPGLQAAHNNGAWHLCVITVARAGNVSFYVDNSLEQALDVTSVTGSVNNASGFNIGADQGSLFLDGDVDEFGLWNRVLTSTERANLYNGGSGTTYPFTGL